MVNHARQPVAQGADVIKFKLPFPIKWYVLYDGKKLPDRCDYLAEHNYDVNWKTKDAI